MISPTRTPACLRCFAIRFSLALMIVCGHHRYFAGCGSGLVTSGAFSGNLLGGGGLTGSRVGDTGSSRGMTVYLLTGSPICATADLPWWMASVPPLTDIRQLLEGHAV